MSGISDRLAALDMVALRTEVAGMIAEDPVPGSLVAMEFAFAHADGGFEEVDPRSAVHAGAFASFVGRLAADAVERALERLVREVGVDADGRVAVWREMVVPGDWGAEGIASVPLGVCWAWDPGAAEAHNGKGGGDGRVLAVVEASVGLDAVDWSLTAALAAAGDHTVGDEREIRLRDDAVVEVLGVRARPLGTPAGHGRALDVSSLSGLLLPAGPDAPMPTLAASPGF